MLKERTLLQRHCHKGSMSVYHCGLKKKEREKKIYENSNRIIQVKTLKNKIMPS